MRFLVTLEAPPVVCGRCHLEAVPVVAQAPGGMRFTAPQGWGTLELGGGAHCTVAVALCPDCTGLVCAAVEVALSPMADDPAAPS